MAAGLAAAALFPYAVAWGQHGQARHLAQFVYALAGDLCEKRRLGGGVAKEARFGGVARRPGPDRGGAFRPACRAGPATSPALAA